MKKINIFLLSIFWVAWTFYPQFSSFAQTDPIKAKQAEKIALKGDGYLKDENYAQALLQYSQSLALDSNNVRALTNGGICRLLTSPTPLAVKQLERGYLLDPKFDIQMHYWLGRAYHLNLQPDAAIEAYNKYLYLLSGTDLAREDVIQLIRQARFLKKFMETPTDNTIVNLGAVINSPHSDYSPVLTSDGKTMIFTSRRNGDEKVSEATGKAEGFETIYIANQFFDGSWSKPVMMTSQSGSAKRGHLSGVQLFDNDTKLLVYNSSRFGSLYAADRDGNNWSEPVALNKYTHTSDYESSGFVNERDSTVYFASDRGSKNGDLDLFVSHRLEDNKWSEPQRLPDMINTDKDEDAPYITKDGMTLYFSSRGHDGMGGYDVYKSHYTPTTHSWSRPVNIGFPMNSPADDIYFIMNDSSGIGYVSSNRIGTLGGADLFKVKPLESILLNGVVTDKNTKKPLPGFDLRFTALSTNEVSASVLTGKEGIYNARLRSKNRYRIEIVQGDKVWLTDEIHIPLEERENVKIFRDFSLDVPALPLPPAVKKLVMPNLSLSRITYQEYDTLEINGVVRDSAGVLSSVRVQLREEGSSEAKLSTTTDKNGNYHFAFIPGKQEDYVVEMAHPGYQFASVVVLYTPKQQPSAKKKVTSTQFNEVNSLDLSMQLVALKVGARSVLGGVYFDFNSAVIKTESNIILDRLAKFLNENPTVRIEIGGFTDDTGSAYTNRVVAQKRAQAIVNYLIEKGTDKTRLTAKAYGEEQPVASNAAEINGRDINRRIEVKILAL